MKTKIVLGILLAIALIGGAIYGIVFGIAWLLSPGLIADTVLAIATGIRFLQAYILMMLVVWGFLSWIWLTSRSVPVCDDLLPGAIGYPEGEFPDFQSDDSER